MKQLTLTYNDPIAGRARKSDPASSVAAARACNAEGQRGRLLAALRSASRPLYAAQLADRLSIPTGEVTSRLAVMRRLGQVQPLAELGCNQRGQPVQLWTLVEAEGEQDVRVSERYL